MAMPAALARYWRNKRGGKKRARRSTGSRKRSSHRSHSKAIAHRSHHSPRPAPRKQRRHRGGGGGGDYGSLVTARVLVPAAVLAAAYGYFGQNSGGFEDTMRQIPGVKTLGVPLVVGGTAFLINRYLYPNKWLRLLSAVGLVLAALQWGKTKFAIPEWAGDVADADGAVANVT